MFEDFFRKVSAALRASAYPQEDDVHWTKHSSPSEIPPELFVNGDGTTRIEAMAAFVGGRAQEGDFDPFDTSVEDEFMINIYSYAEAIVSGNIDYIVEGLEHPMFESADKEAVVNAIEDKIRDLNYSLSQEPILGNLADLRERLGLDVIIDVDVVVDGEPHPPRPPKRDAKSILELPKAISQEEAGQILDIEAGNLYTDKVPISSRGASFTTTEDIIVGILGEDYSARLDTSNVPHRIVDFEFKGEDTRMVAMDNKTLNQIEQGIGTKDPARFVG